MSAAQKLFEKMYENVQQGAAGGAGPDMGGFAGAGPDMGGAAGDAGVCAANRQFGRGLLARIP